MSVANWPIFQALLASLQQLQSSRGWFWNTTDQQFTWTEHSELLPSAPAKLEALIDGLTDSAGREQLHTYFRNPDGNELNVVTPLVQDNNTILLRWLGRPVDGGVIGIVIDQRNQRLDNIKQAVLDVLFKQSGQMVMVTDPKQRILYANPHTYQHLGYTPEQLTQRHFDIFECDKQTEEFYDLIQQKLYKEGSWHGELWSQKHDGTPYLHELQLNRLSDSQQQVLGYMAVSKDMTAQHQRTQAVRRLAYYDTNSGLPNGAFLRKQLPGLVTLTQQKHRLLVVLVINVREFAHIADVNGEAFATTLSRILADRLKRFCSARDVVARLATDLYAMTISSLSSDEELLQLLPRITQVFAQPFPVEDEQYFLGCSIGVSLYQTDASSAEQLLSHATQAMYTMRQSNKNDYVFFSNTLQTEVKRQLQLVQALRKTLADSTFTVLFQPIIDTHTGQLIKVEAFFSAPKLVEEFGTNTGELIQLAERYDEVRNIDNAVAALAIKEFAIFRQLSKAPIALCVNRSMSYGHHADDVRALLRASKIPPSQLIIEVTETTFFDRSPDFAEEFASLTELGVNLALDDFGTGNTSLTALVAMPFQSLKIDRSLIKAADESPSGEDLVVASIRLAKGLGLRIVAEGVESQQHADWLSHSGCDELQGYAFSRPLSGADIRAFIQKAQQQPLYKAAMKNDVNAVGGISVPVTVVNADTTLEQLQPKLDEHACKVVLVEDEGALVGVVDELAIAAARSPFTGTEAALPRDDAILHRHAHQIMHRSLVKIRRDASLEATSRLLEQHPDTVIVVMNEHDELHGVVNRDILLSALRKVHYS